jgi:hypothetical protein
VGLAVLLLGGLAAAVVLRTAVGGAGVARSPVAGLLFAGVLVALAAIARPQWLPRPARTSPLRGLAYGLAGAVVLCLPALASRWDAGTLAARPGDAFFNWAAVVAVVAIAEEWFLRGVLHRLLEPRGTVVALLVPAGAFAALHLPLYGLAALPLDLAVGIWLGALRIVAGRWSAAAVAHVVADWAAWFIA